MTRIKICGITNVKDAVCAVECGADALGFVFADSPRRVTPETARAVLDEVGPFITGVGVFVNEDLMVMLKALMGGRCSALQLHGEEGPEVVAQFPGWAALKAFRVRDQISEEQLLPFRQAHAILLDTYVPGRPGGTGEQFDHRLATDLVRRGWRIVLAGGLTPDTVYDAVRAVRPYAVDVSSGVEASPGRKDHRKVEDFIAAVRAADANRGLPPNRPT